MYTIEKNVPLPEVKTQKAFLQSLEIGDSFVANTRDLRQMQGNSKNYGIKILTKKIDNNYTRAWRIA
jgi:hypothetical protein